MKKRLLISSVLMSAVLACALGTGTYAWYNASSAGGIATATATGTVNTTNPSITIGGDITLSTKEVKPVSNKTLHMAEYNAESSKWETYYLNQQGAEVAYNYSEKGGVAMKAYTVEISFADAAAALEALAGKTMTVSVAKDEGANERGHVFIQSNALNDDEVAGEETSITYTFGTDLASFTGTKTVAYVGVWFDGNNESADTDAIAIPFTVTLD